MLAEPIDGDDPTPLLDHLLAVERQTGARPPILLNGPVLPDGCEQLWHIFNELHSCRGQGRITYADIDAFQRVTNVRLLAWERDAITMADNAYLRRERDRLRSAQT